MTSNLGTSYAGEKRKIGFGEVGNQEETRERGKHVSRALKRFFPPEFLGRVEVVAFESLKKNVLVEICEKELERLEVRLGISLKASSRAKEQLIAEGTSPDFGARELASVICRRLQTPLAKLLLSGELKAGDTVKVTTDSSGKGYQFALPCKSSVVLKVRQGVCR